MNRITTIVLALLVAGIVGGGALYSYTTLLGPDADLVGDNYVAALLTTGQVYFGKVESLNSEYVVFNNVYYIQETATPGATDFSQPDLLLVKSGNELHGPQNLMHLNRDHVIFLQPLRDDSQVVTLINENEMKLRAERVQ